MKNKSGRLYFYSAVTAEEVILAKVFGKLTSPPEKAKTDAPRLASMKRKTVGLGVIRVRK